MVKSWGNNNSNTFLFSFANSTGTLSLVKDGEIMKLENQVN